MRLVPIILLLAVSCLAQVTYVDRNAVGTGDGSSWTDAFTDLQAALGAASSGEVWVASGTYRPAAAGGLSSATFTLTPGVALYGGFAGGESALAARDVETNATVLSGDLDGDDFTHGIFSDNVDHVVTAISVGATSVLDGFVVRGGRAPVQGGGLLAMNATPTVANCIFEDNRAGTRGGAIAATDGVPSLTRCVFSRNRAGVSGGAVDAIRTTGVGVLALDRCVFVRNRVLGGGLGGAVSADGALSVDVDRCIFVDNHVEDAGSGTMSPAGGAVAVLGPSAAIRRSRFTHNGAGLGGGVYAVGTVGVNNSLFAVNEAVESLFFNDGGHGGGIHAGTLLVQGCTFFGNWADNRGGGLHSGNGTVESSILWGNDVTPAAPGEDPVLILRKQIGGNVSLSYSDVEGVFEIVPGEDPPNPADFPGCIDSDPLFVDPAMVQVAGINAPANLRLAPASPCIDAADNGGFPVGAIADLVGETRFHDDPATVDTGSGAAPIADMGAFEFGPWSGNLPQASFGFTTNVLTANFTDTSTSPNGAITARVWDFGQGPDSCLPHPTHRYASPGTYSAALTVFDAEGARGTSAPQSIPVADTSPPTINITSPSNGAAVSGTTTISVMTTDDDVVTRVDYRLDGTGPFTGLIIGTITTPPFDFDWDTDSILEGPHTITAVARDAAGNQASSAPLSLIVANAPAMITAPPPALDRVVPLGDTLETVVSASGQYPINYTLVGGPAGLTLAGNLITWTPTPAQLGLHPVTIDVSNVSGQDTVTFDLEVIPRQYVITTWDLAGSSDTFLMGLNDAGHISGMTNHTGFIFDGTATTSVTYPGGSVRGYDLNDDGYLSGATYNATGYHGFIRDPAGNFDFNLPFASAYENHPYGLNDAGEVAGMVRFNPGPTVTLEAYTTLGGGQIISPAGSTNARAFGINDVGQVVGDWYVSGSVPRHSFVWDVATGTHSFFSVPEGSSTIGWGINDHGHVAGAYGSPGPGGWKAFVCRSAARNPGDFIRLRIPGSASVLARKINDHGVVVGTWESSSVQYEYHGFIATPVALIEQPDLGYGGPGNATLRITGELSTGNTADLLVEGAPPAASLVLLLGTAFNPTPFLGGTVVVHPFDAIVAGTTDAAGAWSAPDIPGGFAAITLNFQAIYADPSTASGIGITNAIAAQWMP